MSYKLVIVETSKEFRNFAKVFNELDSIVIPIECDFNKHPKDTKLCLLYIKTISEDSKEYILPFRHSDALNLEIHMIDNLWTSKNVYTYDKKKLLHFPYDIDVIHLWDSRWVGQHFGFKIS